MNAFPNLSGLCASGSKTDNNCLPPPFNQPRNQQVKQHERLRGVDAVFWKVKNGEMVVDGTLYPYDEHIWMDIEANEDKNNAINALQGITQSGVQTTPLPVDSVLFHWTRSFPIGCKEGDVVKTQGYNWTSTSDTFKWSRPQRLVVIAPQGTPVWIDPTSQSHRIPCDEDASKRHQDVVLPPATYQVVTADEYKRLAGETLKENVRKLCELAVEELFKLTLVGSVANVEELPERVVKNNETWTLFYPDSYTEQNLMYLVYSKMTKTPSQFLFPAVSVAKNENAIVVNFDKMQHMENVVMLVSVG